MAAEVTAWERSQSHHTGKLRRLAAGLTLVWGLLHAVRSIYDYLSPLTAIQEQGSSLLNMIFGVVFGLLIATASLAIRRGAMLEALFAGALLFGAGTGVSIYFIVERVGILNLHGLLAVSYAFVCLSTLVCLIGLYFRLKGKAVSYGDV